MRRTSAAASPPSASNTAYDASTTANTRAERPDRTFLLGLRHQIRSTTTRTTRPPRTTPAQFIPPGLRYNTHDPRPESIAYNAHTNAAHTEAGLLKRLLAAFRFESGGDQPACHVLHQRLDNILAHWRQQPEGLIRWGALGALIDALPEMAQAIHILSAEQCRELLLHTQARCDALFPPREADPPEAQPEQQQIDYQQWHNRMARLVELDKEHKQRESFSLSRRPADADYHHWQERIAALAAADRRAVYTLLDHPADFVDRLGHLQTLAERASPAEQAERHRLENSLFLFFDAEHVTGAGCPEKRKGHSGLSYILQEASRQNDVQSLAALYPLLQDVLDHNEATTKLLSAASHIVTLSALPLTHRLKIVEHVLTCRDNTDENRAAFHVLLDSAMPITAPLHPQHLRVTAALVEFSERHAVNLEAKNLINARKYSLRYYDLLCIKFRDTNGLRRMINTAELSPEEVACILPTPAISRSFPFLQPQEQLACIGNCFARAPDSYQQASWTRWFDRPEIYQIAHAAAANPNTRRAFINAIPAERLQDALNSSSCTPLATPASHTAEGLADFLNALPPARWTEWIDTRAIRSFIARRGRADIQNVLLAIIPPESHQDFFVRFANIQETRPINT